MKRYLILILSAVFLLTAETLFQVKDSLDRVVLDVSTDGLRVYNEGDLLMEISSSDIRAFIEDNPAKGLARSFSVTTSSNVKNETNVLEITTQDAKMREGRQGQQYTDFSPENMFLGLNSGINTTVGTPYEYSGLYNINLGNYTGLNNTSGYQNIFIGYESGLSNLVGHHNTFIGYRSGYNNNIGGGSGATASYNTFIGNESGFNNNGGFSNTFIGNQAGFSNTNAHFNVFIGHESGYANTTASGNTFLGYMSGSRSTQNGNTFIGAWSGWLIVTGARNSFYGLEAGSQQTSGSENSYFGARSAYYNSQGSYNSLLGYESGYGSHGNSYSNNSFFGYRAGYSTSTGSDNVYIGYRAGYLNNTGASNIFIGTDAGYSETGSNKLYIANSSTVDPLIYGEFDNRLVKINGRLGVGVNPTRMLHVEDVTTTNDNPAIFGKHNVSNSWGVGVRGEGGFIGVDAYANATTYDIYGVRSFATGDGAGSRTGVFTSAGGGGNTNYGIYATTSGTAGTRWAGWFEGNVRVTGTFNNTKSETKVDHPLDPENRYLSHATVGSSEMINVYNGNAVLDTNGNARINLPEWFESYNTDFKYQLTPVGAPALLYISQEIKNNEFEISGGSEGMKVSWQVTGTRNDNYAKKNPIEPESYKDSEHTGLYINPEVFGFGSEKSIERAMDKDRDNR